MASTTRSWFATFLVATSGFLSLAPLKAETGRQLSDKEVADKLRFYERIDRLSAPFKQTKTLKEIGIALDSKGRIEIERPSKVRWIVEQPSPITVTVDGKKVSLESESGSEKKKEQWDLGSVSDERLSKALVGMLAWMRLDVATIQSSYTITEMAGGALRAVPRDTSAVPFKALVFRIHKDGHLDSLRLEEVSGDEIAIDFGTPRFQRKTTK